MYAVIGDEHYIIESRSHPGEWHCCESGDGGWECSCLGFIRWQRCWHVRFCEALSRAASSQESEVVLLSGDTEELGVEQRT